MIKNSVCLVLNAIAVGLMAGLALRSDMWMIVPFIWIIAGVTYFWGQRLAVGKFADELRWHDARIEEARVALENFNREHPKDSE